MKQVIFSYIFLIIKISKLIRLILTKMSCELTGKTAIKFMKVQLVEGF